VLSFTRLDIVVMQQRVKFSLPQIVFRRRPPVSYQLCIVRSSLTQQSRAGERCEFDPMWYEPLNTHHRAFQSPTRLGHVLSQLLSRVCLPPTVTQLHTDVDMRHLSAPSDYQPLYPANPSISSNSSLCVQNYNIG
jgi:hypothetical protein